MKKNLQNNRRSFRGIAGFSLIEVMIVLLILTVVTGIILNIVTQLQRRNSNETAKVDITQESREFVDQMTRDIHQGGYPNYRMVQGATVASAAAALNIAVQGLSNPLAGATSLQPCAPPPSVAPCAQTTIQFEGDLDGSGTIQEVQLTLAPDPVTGSCPCSLQRGLIAKSAYVAPGAWTYYTQLNGVINSGLAGGGAQYAIAGAFPGGATYDAFFASYKNQPVFQLLDATGAPWYTNEVADGFNGQTAIKTIRIAVNVLSPNPDLQTHIPPVVSMAAETKLNN